GLSFSTSNERLREVFAATGNVESAAVVTDRDTGRSRGFGFVEMATPEDAEQAISKLNGTSVDGRTIQVERAKSPGAGGGRSGGGGGGRRWWHLTPRNLPTQASPGFCGAAVGKRCREPVVPRRDRGACLSAPARGAASD